MKDLRHFSIDKDKFIELYYDPNLKLVVSGKGKAPSDQPNEEDEENIVVTKQKPIVKGKKIGRNELCPCGSGKKAKKCCGIQR